MYDRPSPRTARSAVTAPRPATTSPAPLLVDREGAHLSLTPTLWGTPDHDATATAVYAETLAGSQLRFDARGFVTIVQAVPTPRCATGSRRTWTSSISPAAHPA